MASDAGILLSELRHVVDDLQRLVGRPVTGARVPTPTSVVLDLHGAYLYLESWPSPRLHTVRRPPKNPRTPFSFQGILRARLHGPVTRIALANDDRVVEIEVGPLTLHARLLGRGGGIWLCQGDRVLAASDGPAPDTLPPIPDGRPDSAAPRFAPVEGESWDEAADRHLGELSRETALTALRTHVRRALGARSKRARRLAIFGGRVVR